MLRVNTCALTIAAVLCAGCQARNDTAEGAASSGRALEQRRCVRRLDPSSCAMFGVSLYELLARPEAYDGKVVQLTGFVHVEFEGSGIYPHREDAEQGLFSNGLWISANGLDSLNDRYVLVEGRFDAQMRGHLGAWSGSIVDVRRLDPHIWPFRNPPVESIPTVDLKTTRPAS